MKNGILAIAILFMIGQLQAQLKVGIHGGTDINNINISGVPDMITDLKQNTTNGSYGIHAEMPLGSNVSLRGELNHTRKGFDLNESFTNELIGMNFPIGIKANTKLSYVEVPLLIAYTKPLGNINLIGEAGPVLAYGISGRIQPIATLGLDFTLPEINVNFKNDGFNRINAGGSVGLAVETVLAENVSLYAKTRYTHSFTDILNNPIVDIKTKANTVHFGIGINYTI